jgi:hypothetical protein
MDEVIVILDDNGSALGAVRKNEDVVVLVDTRGKTIQEVSIKISVKEAKDILLRRKLSFIV